jgi:hypothetical protein
MKKASGNGPGCILQVNGHRVCHFIQTEGSFSTIMLTSLQ